MAVVFRAIDEVANLIEAGMRLEREEVEVSS
jgi:hypothetical protein